MRINRYQLQGALFGSVLSPDLRPREEEALLRRQPIDERRRGLLLLQLRKERRVRQLEAAEVRDVLAARQLAVELLVVHLELGGLLHLHGGAPLILRRVRWLPPVIQVALVIILPPLVVEAVCHLVADDCPHRPKVDGIVRLGVEERRLKDGRGEDDLVEVGVVVGVDLLRQHQPAAPVGRRVGEAHLARVLEGPRAQHVAQVVALHHLQLRVIDPLVGVPDLDAELIHLLDGALPRGGAHPLHLVQPLLQRLPHALHRLERALLCVLREVFAHVDLANRLAERLLDEPHRPLPPRFLLLLPLQRLGVELKVAVDEFLRQVLRARVDRMPTEVRAHLLGARRLEQPARRGEGWRRVAVDRGGRGLSDELEVPLPVDPPLHQRGKLGTAHLIVHTVRVPPLRARHVRTRERRLQLEDGRRLRAGRAFLLASQREHLRDVLLVQLALVRLVLVEVVVSIRQPEPRLLQLEESPLRLLVVRPFGRREEDVHPELRVERGDGRRLVSRRQVACVEHRLEGGETGGLDRRLVHHAAPVRRHLLLISRGGAGGWRG
mmetsp:Transcript_49930/g.124151  ORF Transcript_49930/g.124151 Transcript_49930/m.124151 type:complete len:550 (-) Transcript_49930:300-1949(-)